MLWYGVILSRNKDSEIIECKRLYLHAISNISRAKRIYYKISGNCKSRRASKFAIFLNKILKKRILYEILRFNYRTKICIAIYFNIVISTSSECFFNLIWLLILKEKLYTARKKMYVDEINWSYCILQASSNFIRWAEKLNVQL